MPETPTQVLNGAGAFDGTEQVHPLPPSKPARHRIAWIGAAVAVTLLVLGAVAVIILTNQGKGKSAAQSALAAATVYQSKLSGTLTPIVSANRTVSQALQTVDGSGPTLRAATNATAAAQQATTAARGAVAIITVPLASQTLSQEAAQALTQEAGYLQAVSSTLSDPGGSAPSSLQPLASATSSAFVPLANVATGGSVSLFGIDNLQAWVSGAKRAATPRVTQPVTVVTPPPTVVTPPSTVVTPSSSGGDLTACDQNISANGSTSCGLAENVFVAYWNSGNSTDGWSDASITAQSPATSGFYAFDCTSDGTTVNCSATGRTGDSLFVTFPLEAVTVY